jgi:hypothetical protein
MMNAVSRVMGTLNGYAQQARLAGTAWVELPPRELYNLLYAYYTQNGVYDALALASYQAGIWREATKEIRCPANRIVEVYAAKMLGGTLEEALEIQAENERIVEPIQRVWHWSNFARRKQVFSRYSACFGTVFLKVAASDSRQRVYFQIIHPGHVSDFKVDERDFVTECRIDVPITRRTADQSRRLTSTEVWSEPDQSYRLWEHDRPVDTPTDQLGPPLRTASLSDFGIDFVPVVLHKHRDIGEDRGLGAFTHALTKIDEANRSATRLHQLLFRHNRPIDSIESPGRDSSGRPVPPPTMEGDAGGEITIGDDVLLRLPGGWQYRSMVADLHYADALAILNAQLAELEDDCPELTFARIREIPDASGVALRYRLIAATDRILEARGNAQESIQRADMMALTMGQQLGVEGFRDIGSFDAGDFEHSFVQKDVIELDSLSLATEEQTRATAFTTATGSTLPTTFALQRVYGMTEAEAAETAELMAAQVEQSVEVEQ